MIGQHKVRQNKNVHLRTAEYLDYVICAILSTPFFIPRNLGQTLMPFTAVQSSGLTLSLLLWDTSDFVKDTYELGIWASCILAVTRAGDTSVCYSLCEFLLLLTKWSQGFWFNQVISASVVLCKQGAWGTVIPCSNLCL